MNTQAPVRPELTEAELRAAWQRCVDDARRRLGARSSWPATFEEAMADATLSRLVRLSAQHPPRAAARTREQQAGPPQPARAPRPWTTSSPMPPGLDRKRLAAGERDDD